MSTFQIMEDVENHHAAKYYGKKKMQDLPKTHVAQKQYVAENRGVLQPVNNGVRQDTKRLRLSTEERIEVNFKNLYL